MLYDKTNFEQMSKYASNPRTLGKVYVQVAEYKPSRVLDVGCGEGHLVESFLKAGVDAVGMDNSPFAGNLIKGHFVVADATKRFPFTDNSFDVCVSKDFFEHLEEKDIDFVYSEMKRVAKNVVALICYKSDRMFWDHKTIKDYLWWKERLPECKII